MTYKLIIEHSLWEFEETVNAFIRKGWTPFGGACISGSTFAQAMILLTSDPDL